MSTKQASDSELVVEAGVNLEKSVDEQVVDWDGPDDPENPQNWSSFKRYTHVILISLFTLYG